MSFLIEVLLLLAHALFLVVFFCLSFGVGALLLHLLRLNIRDGLLQVSLSCGIGAWCLSQCVMLLGVLGLLDKPFLWGLCAFLLITSLVVLRKIQYPARKILHDFLSLLKPGVAVFLVFYLGVCLVGLSVPDLSYDGLKYHLYFPRLYLEADQIRFLPHNMLSAFPQNMELLYMIGLSLGEGFARIPNVFFITLSVLLLAQFTEEISVSKGAGIFAALSFLTLPVVFEGAAGAYVDVAAGFYGLSSLWCLVKGHMEEKKEWFFLAGLLSAAGLGIKYLYIIQIVSLSLFLIFWGMLRKGKKKIFPTSVFIFIGTSLCFGSPWYFRNYLVTGNPTYPLFYSIFGGPFWSHELERGLLAVRSQFGPVKTFSHFILLPFYLMREDCLFFAFIPCLVILKNTRSKWIRSLMGLCVLEAAIWFFALTLQMRYGIFWLMLWCTIVGAALGKIVGSTSYSRLFRGSIAFLLCCLTMISAKEPLALMVRGTSVVLGLKTREEILRRYVESYAVMKYVSESLPVNARIASFGDVRGYYCKQAFYPIHPDVSGYIDLNQMQDAYEYYRRLKEIGITHLIYNPRRTEIFRRRYPRWIQLQQELQEQYLEPILRKNNVSLYKLKSL